MPLCAWLPSLLSYMTGSHSFRNCFSLGFLFMCMKVLLECMYICLYVCMCIMCITVIKEVRVGIFLLELELVVRHEGVGNLVFCKGNRYS